MFRVGETDYQGIDVALAAMARGNRPAFERRLKEAHRLDWQRIELDTVSRATGHGHHGPAR